MSMADPKGEVYLITDAGAGKRVPMKDFPTQGRYGVGTIAMAVKGKSKLVGAVVGAPDEKLVMITSKGGGRIAKLDEAPKRGRPAHGGAVIKLKPGDAVEGLTPFVARFSMPSVEPPAPKKKQKPGKKASAPKAKRRRRQKRDKR